MRLNSGVLEFYDGTTWRSTDQGASGAGACSQSGLTRYNSSRFEFCNGSVWRTTDTGVNDGACSAAGTTRYSSGAGQFQFCNGTNWRNTFASVINGVCTSNFEEIACTAGTVDNIAYSHTGGCTEYYNYQCVGSGGGSTANCQALFNIC